MEKKNINNNEKSFLYKDAVKALRNIPEVVEIHAITGQYTIFIKILCKKCKLVI